MRTVTFSAMECTAAKRGLEQQRDKLGHDHADRRLLSILIDKFHTCETVTFARVEVFCSLRYLRRQFHDLHYEMMALEERHERGGIDGELYGQHRALETECGLLTNVTRILWIFTQDV